MEEKKLPGLCFGVDSGDHIPVVDLAHHSAGDQTLVTAPWLSETFQGASPTLATTGCLDFLKNIGLFLTIAI